VDFQTPAGGGRSATWRRTNRA